MGENWIISLSDELAQYDGPFQKARAAGDWPRCIAAYVTVLTRISTGLSQLPGFDANVLPLSDLILRLSDLSMGNNAMPPPEREQKGRPPEGYRFAIIQGRSAACVTLLFVCGMDEPKALKFVVDELCKLGVIGRQGKPISIGTVRAWRSKVSDATAYCELPEARSVYIEMLSTLDVLLPDSPVLGEVKAYVRRFLANPRLSR